MRIIALELTQFRCFLHKRISLDAPIVLITGANGSGKTSLLEALHFGCYLRSFRTSSSHDMYTLGAAFCSVRITFTPQMPDTSSQDLFVAHMGKKKIAKVDNVALKSFKDLFTYYRIITIFEDDLLLIKGSPAERRHFLDSALSLLNPDYARALKTFKKVLENRNALLLDEAGANSDMLMVWTEQLWRSSYTVVTMRMAFLDSLQQKVIALLHQYIHPHLSLAFQYQGDTHDTWDSFQANRLKDLIMPERYQKRTLFGAHLDDFTITFNQKGARLFSSRGQQKLLLMLIKVAQIHLLKEQSKDCILLIDDFMADFDPIIGLQMLNLLCSLGVQLIFTAPSAHGSIEQELLKRNSAHIVLE